MLKQIGFTNIEIPIPAKVSKFITEQNWLQLDNYLNEYLNSQDFKELLSPHTDRQQIEFIISIRTDPDEDGIWHDDGSRDIAFSIALTDDDYEGGVLNIRKKGAQDFISLKINKAGSGIIFLTGQHGYEHKINAVTKGRRIIVAGWCS